MAALGPTTNLSATTSILPQQDRSARSGCRRCCCSTWGNDGEGVPHPRRGDADHRRERDDGGGGAYARDGARRQSTAGDARRFRGAGPLHACHVAAKLRVGRVMVPLRAGVLSALGLLVVPPAYDIVRTHKVPLKELDAANALIGKVSCPLWTCDLDPSEFFQYSIMRSIFSEGTRTLDRRTNP